MAAITINGVAIPSFRETIREETITIGSEPGERGPNGMLLGSEAIEKRRWTFQTPPIEPSQQRALRSWLNGHYLTWRFGPHGLLASTGIRNRFDIVHGLNFADGPIEGRVEVSAGSFLQYHLPRFLWMPKGWSPKEGWSLGVKRLDSVAAGDTGSANGWQDYLATRERKATGTPAMVRNVAIDADVKQYRNGTLGTHLINMFANVSDSGGDVAVTGFRLNNASNAVRYAEMFFCPFQIPAEWVSQLTTFRATNLLPAAPYVYLGGDWIGDEAPLLVRCRARGFRQQAGNPGGGFTSVMRWFDVEIEEV